MRANLGAYRQYLLRRGARRRRSGRALQCLEGRHRRPTRGYAARLVKQGITVNAVAPSLIETDMVHSGLASSAARIPLGRFGTGGGGPGGHDADGNEYMTGQTVALSGGMAFN